VDSSSKRSLTASESSFGRPLPLTNVIASSLPPTHTKPNSWDPTTVAYNLSPASRAPRGTPSFRSMLLGAGALCLRRETNADQALRRWPLLDSGAGPDIQRGRMTLVARCPPLRSIQWKLQKVGLTGVLDWDAFIAGESTPGARIGLNPNLFSHCEQFRAAVSDPN
jgi:hypothetical protein